MQYARSRGNRQALAAQRLSGSRSVASASPLGHVGGNVPLNMPVPVPTFGNFGTGMTTTAVEVSKRTSAGGLGKAIHFYASFPETAAIRIALPKGWHGVVPTEARSAMAHKTHRLSGKKDARAVSMVTILKGCHASFQKQASGRAVYGSWHVRRGRSKPRSSSRQARSSSSKLTAGC